MYFIEHIIHLAQIILDASVAFVILVAIFFAFA